WVGQRRVADGGLEGDRVADLRLLRESHVQVRRTVLQRQVEVGIRQFARGVQDLYVEASSVGRSVEVLVLGVGEELHADASVLLAVAVVDLAVVHRRVLEERGVSLPLEGLVPSPRAFTIPVSISAAAGEWPG